MTFNVNGLNLACVSVVTIWLGMVGRLRSRARHGGRYSKTRVGVVILADVALKIVVSSITSAAALDRTVEPFYRFSSIGGLVLSGMAAKIFRVHKRPRAIRFWAGVGPLPHLGVASLDVPSILG